ncbi:hypothetical protein EXIGLDRAFT_773580 [Exidia glandulosa HHB12029]|uniref:Fungal calcium binding protein domain-containing protein n=1 Tax=Exidia glandulosa HHB12029 TaxID=1314781 RepID=A0A165ER69_EXIGL|nr:hypothetical protein EXIGLDRAFT_773580 [Exidia glandulosa HHB12029]
MRFSIASVSAVVLAAVSLAAAAPSCNLPQFISCVIYVQNQYAGSQVAHCVEDANNQQHFSLNDPATKRCLDEVAGICEIKGVPGQCNGCLCAAGFVFPGLKC